MEFQSVVVYLLLVGLSFFIGSISSIHLPLYTDYSVSFILSKFVAH